MAGGNLSDESSLLATAAYLLCAAVFLVLMFYSLFRSMEPLSKIQVAPLRTRLYWSVKANVYICLLSAFLNLLHVTNFEYTIAHAISSNGDSLIIKPVEYLVTCPVMMLTIVVLGGEEVPQRRQLECMGLTSVVLLCGFFASMSNTVPMKLMFFVSGCTFFAILVGRVSASVREHSGGEEKLLNGFGGSVYKHLCLKIISTWILFPTWWVLSKEGLGIISDPDMNILVTASLNIFAKGVYVVHIQCIHDKYMGEESLMVHPEPKRAAERDAQYAAGRLGPAGAIAALEKSIEHEKRSISYIQKMTACTEGEEATENAGSDLGGMRSNNSNNSPTNLPHKKLACSPVCEEDANRRNMNDGVSKHPHCVALCSVPEPWEELAMLVSHVCCQQGAKEYTVELLQEFQRQQVRSLQTLGQLSSSDFESLRVPIGLRHCLQNAARTSLGQQQVDEKYWTAPAISLAPTAYGESDPSWKSEGDGVSTNPHSPAGNQRRAGDFHAIVLDGGKARGETLATHPADCDGKLFIPDRLIGGKAS